MAMLDLAALCVGLLAIGASAFLFARSERLAKDVSIGVTNRGVLWVELEKVCKSIEEGCPDLQDRVERFRHDLRNWETQKVKLEQALEAEQEQLRAAHLDHEAKMDDVLRRFAAMEATATNCLRAAENFKACERADSREIIAVEKAREAEYRQVLDILGRHESTISKAIAGATRAYESSDRVRARVLKLEHLLGLRAKKKTAKAKGARRGRA